jgi:hypothetical protein
MFHLEDNRFGPAGNLAMDLTQTGILGMQKQNLQFVELSTLHLAIPGLNSTNDLPSVPQLDFDFESISIHHENVGIVYLKRADSTANDVTFSELFQIGYQAPHDALTRSLVISNTQWNEMTNKGGIELTNGEANTNVKIFFVFAAWHRENVGDADSPWIQNDIKPITTELGDATKYGEITTRTITITKTRNGRPVQVAIEVPDTIKFSFEDMTGPIDRYISDHDYNDMEITARFNYAAV